MNRFYYLLTILLLVQGTAFGQNCTPDPNLRNTEFGLFPSPDDAGGFDGPACLGQYFEQVFTLIVPEEFDIFNNGNPSAVNFVSLNSIANLPTGLNYACDPPTCVVEGGDRGCLIISGTVAQSNTLGFDTLVMSGTLDAAAGSFTTNFPDPINFPNQFYFIDVRDENCTPNNCALSLTTASTSETCSTANNGTATVTVQPGTAPGPYTYLWDANAGSQTTQTATNLDGGIYSVTVTSSDNCSSTTSVQVGTQLGSVNLEIVDVVNAECGGNGTATVNVTNNPNSTYEYLWSNGETTQTATMLPPGENTVTVTRQGGCSNTASVTIEVTGNAIQYNINTQAVSCPGGNDGAAIVQVQGGGASFQWSDGAGQQAQATNLQAGDYTVEISKDGCTVTEIVQIQEPDPIVINIQKQDAACDGSSKGRARASASGGNGGAFTYAWSQNNQSNDLITNLDPGTYMVTATDEDGCTAVETVTIGGLATALDISVEKANASCAGNDGAARIVINGDASGVTYQWSDNNSTSNARNNLIAGTYVVTISKNGCTTTRTIEIEGEGTIDVQLSKTDASCDGSTLGAISATASGGAGGYSYQWSGPSANNQTESTITNLMPGNYSVTVTDSDNCSTVQNITVEGAGGFSFSVDKTDASCAGEDDGTAMVVLSGNTVGVQISWSNGLGNNQSVTGLAPGDYTVTVTDAGGNCSSEQSITIEAGSNIQLTVDVTNGNCGQGTLGAARANPTGGSGSFSYSWSTGQSSRNVNGLPAGQHTVTVTDAQGCSVIETFTIELAGLFDIVVDSSPASCGNSTDGAAAINTPVGPNFDYLWSTNSNANVLRDLSPGVYTVTITDSSTGCRATETVVIEATGDIETEIEVANASCNGVADGSVELNVSGGSGNYDINWTFPTQNPTNVSNLAAGFYNISITDNNSACEEVVVVEIAEPEAVVAEIQKSDISCAGGADGTLFANVSGGTGPYTYQWSGNSSDQQSLAGIAAGEYQLMVTDANGCTATAQAEIINPPALTVDIEVVGGADCESALPDGLIASGEGGTGGYNYRWSTGRSRRQLPTPDPGDYIVTVTDDNGCMATNSVEVTENTNIFETELSVNQPRCAGANDGSINISVNGGSGSYTYTWRENLTGANVSGLAPGTYQVTVADANGTCDQVSTITLENPAPLALSFDVMNFNCDGDDGTLTVNVENGQGTLTYDWSSGSSIATISNVEPINYQVTVTDGNGCTATESIDLTNQVKPFDIVISTQGGNGADCNISLPDAITATVTGTTDNYTFDWSLGQPTNSGNSSTIANPTMGDYTVTVTNSDGCSKTETIQINPGSGGLQVGFDATPVSCVGDQDGVIQVNPVGGSGNYNYDWSLSFQDPIRTARVDNLGTGTYTVIVNDGGSCSDTVSIAITAPDPIEIRNINVQDATCVENTDGLVQLDVRGGTGNLSLIWEGTMVAGNSVDGLAPGDYNYAIVDANGCRVNETVTVGSPDSISITTTLFGGGCDGSVPEFAIASVQGGNGNYNFEWSNGSTRVDTFFIPMMGNYTLNVTDQEGCTGQTTLVVTDEEIPIELDVTATDVTCDATANGSIEVVATGGSGNYQFNWEGNFQGTMLTDLGKGDYILTVTDDKGCETIDSIFVDDPGIFTVSPSVQAERCAGDSNGTVTLIMGRGVPADYTFDWEGDLASSSFVSGLSRGTYTVTITEMGTGCVVVEEVEIPGSDPIQIELASIEDLDCAEDTNGEIIVRVTGGSGALNLSWSNGATATGEGTQTVSDLTAGEQTLTVTDARGCSAQETFIVEAPEPLEVSATTTNANAPGNGSATATITGGTEPYTINWIAESGEPINQSTSMATNLSEGEYIILVTDANGCSASATAIVGGSQCTGLLEVDFDVVNVDCEGNLGSITADASGGFEPYRYEWGVIGADSTATIDSLAAGEYSVTVYDNIGCPTIETVTVRDDSDIRVSFINNKPESCEGKRDGAIQARITGPGQFTYNWRGYPETSNTLENVPAGDVTVEITNNQGCTTVRTVTIGRIMPELSTEITSRTNIRCFGETNGTTSITATGGTAPYIFRWRDDSIGMFRDSLASGTYLVTVFDANECSVSTSVTIDEPTEIQATVQAEAVSCPGVENGFAAITTADGGTGELSFSWPGGATDMSTQNLAPGDYFVTVSDDNNCSAEIPFTIGEPTEITISITSQNESQPNANDGQANVSAMGGTPPYQYRWDDGQTDAMAVNLEPRQHTVTVTDSKGCSTTGTITISDAACSIRITDIVAQAAECNGDNTGSATVQVTGNAGDGLTFAWSPNVGTSSRVTNLSAGVYTVTVTDGSGCTTTEAVTINEPPAIIFGDFTSVANIDCNNANGSASITATGGTGTLSYQWSSSENGQTASMLTEGANTVTVTDANGCQSTASINISATARIDLTADDITGETCAGENDGTATITATGGTGALTYTWPSTVNSTDANATGLAPGDYEVTVTDEGNCEETISVNIPSAVALVSDEPTITGVTCFGESNGTATLNISGGASPYTFTWPANVSNTESATGLPSGTSDVTITDVNGCAIIQTITIEGPETALTIESEKTDESEEGANNGEARVTVTGGTMPYTYDWGESGTTRGITGLAPGTYTVTVTDANGCTEMATITILAGGIACTAINVEVAVTEPNCSNAEGGILEITSISETGNFTYLWSTDNADTSRIVNNVPPGTYTVTVTDERGCPGDTTVTIPEITELAVSFDVTNVDCEDTANGAATINATGGLMPYSYSWSTSGDSDSARVNLANGNYEVTIEDAKGCTEVVEFTIAIDSDTIPPVIETERVTIYLDEFGEAVLEAASLNSNSSDNCAIDAFTIENQETITFTCDQLGLNQVVLALTDKAGNMTMDTAEVMVADTIKPFLMCMQEDVLITNCNAARTITFDTPQAFDNCGSSLAVELIQGLPSGSIFPAGLTRQVFLVTDASGNTDTCSFNVDINVLGVELITNLPSCFGFADGSIEASVENAEGEIFYDWSTQDDTRIITGLSAGVYTVTVIDQQGCTREDSITLENPPLLSAQIDSIVRVSDSLVSIFATVEGGTPPLTYQWVRGEDGTILNTEDLINVPDGAYNLTAIDANACNVLLPSIITSTKEETIDYGVVLKPNPTSGNLFFEIQQTLPRPYRVDLYNINGQLIEHLSTEADRSPSQIFDLSSYQSGVYFVKVQVAGQVVTRRVVLMKE